MLTEEIISTGIEKLDRLLEGGIPKGFTTLILGAPGSGIEILCKQLASNGNVLYFSTEEIKDEIVKTMDKFGWSAEHIEVIDMAGEHSQTVLNGEQTRVNIHGQRSKVNIQELIRSGSSSSFSSTKDENDFLAEFSEKISNSAPEKIILNSLDFFLYNYSQDEVLRTLYAAKIRNLENSSAFMIFMTEGIHGDVFERKMEGLADCVLELEVEQKGSNFERFIAVKKMKNYAKKIGIARYVIDSAGFTLEMVERIM